MTTLSLRIAAFKKIQALPYSVAPNKLCNCATKCNLLSAELKALEIQTRPVFVEFSWTEAGVPHSVYSIPHDTPAIHQYLEVLIPESDAWVVVDPTWDPSLSPTLAAPSWDGKSATESAVPVLHVLDEGETARLLERIQDETFRTEWYKRNDDFLVALEAWLVGLRGR